MGALSVHMLTLVIPPGQAAGLMLPILCLMNLFGLWIYRRHWSRSHRYWRVRLSMMRNSSLRRAS